MKPFDLEAAKRGEPVITSDGRPYTFGAHNPDAEVHGRIVGWIGAMHIAHTEDGRFYAGTCKYDLFMAPKKRVVWERRFIEIGTGDIYSYIRNAQDHPDLTKALTPQFCWIGDEPFRVEIVE